MTKRKCDTCGESMKILYEQQLRFSKIIYYSCPNVHADHDLVPTEEVIV